MNTSRPRAASPRTGWQSADLVVTLVLLVIHGAVFVFSVYFSLGFADAVNCAVPCETPHPGTAYVVTDGGGLLAMIAAIAVSTVLLIRRRPAFWVPILGIGIQVVLLMIGFELATTVTTI